MVQKCNHSPAPAVFETHNQLKMSRFTPLTLFLSLIAFALNAQIDYPAIQPDYGDHQVGYRHLTLIDSARAYSKLTDFDQTDFRPVSISIWEPAVPDSSAQRLKVRDYLHVLSTEEEWPELPFEYFFDWFQIPPTEHNRAQAEHPTLAVADYERQTTDRPIVIYSASYRASSTENFMLGEYLASHGYTMVAIPSKGYDNLNFEGGTIKDATAQSDDLQFVMDRLPELVGRSNADIYLSGFSFGGLSHILNAGTDPRVRGVISLDGTIKYRPEVLDASVHFDHDKFRVPLIHISQKDISRDYLRREQLDTLINDRFSFYDSIAVSVKYQLKSTQLSHQYFATYGLLFQERDVREDADYETIASAYEALLRQVRTSLVYLNDPGYSHDDFDQEVLSSDHFAMIDGRILLRMPGFSELLSRSDLSNRNSLDSTYRVIKSSYPAFEIPEGYLNTLGLQLIFTPETFRAGENVFLFALKLYPGSANLYDSLAEGYRYHGMNELARINFQKSLILNPENGNAIKRLKELE